MKITFLLIVFTLLSAVAVAGDYCGEGKTIYIGDTSSELIMKCGEPDWKQSHTEEIISPPDRDNKRHVRIIVEEWTYNLGPQRFMRVFKLQNGKVVDIWLGDYGFAKEEANEFQCSSLSISVGDSIAAVVAKCGEPAWKDKRKETSRERRDDGAERKVYTTVEEWTYNFGPDKFMRILTFRNGKVTNIQFGGRGYEIKLNYEKE